MVAIASEKTFQSLMKVIGHPEWVADPRFAKYADRRDNWADLMNGRRSLVAHGDDRKMPHGIERPTVSRVRPIARWREALGDPQIAHRGALAEVERWRRHVQGSEPAVPHVRAPPSPRQSGCRHWANTRSRISEGDRAFGRRNSGLHGQAAGGRAALTAKAHQRQHTTCGFSSGARLAALPGLAIPANLTGSTSTIRNTGRSRSGREHEMTGGNPLAQPCANIPCRGIWRGLGCAVPPAPKSRAAASPSASSSIFPVSIR